MTRKTARRVMLVMCCMALSLALWHTVFDQSYFGALFGLAAASAFYYAYRNPQVVLAKSWDEFGELYEKSRDKKFIWGFPTYHAVMLLVILYIWLV